MSSERQILVNGFIFGDDSQLTFPLKTLFRSLGLSHLTAASGANLQLFVPTWFLELIKIRVKLFYFLGELLGVFFYLSMAELSPSLWRAFIFWMVAFIGRVFGRRVSFFSLIIYTTIFTFFKDKEIFGSIGYQLSFLCVLALFFSHLDKNHERSLRELIKPSVIVSLRENIRVSLWIFLFISPYLYYKFRQVVPIGIIGTVLVSPIVQVMTQLGILDKALEFVLSFTLESSTVMSPTGKSPQVLFSLRFIPIDLVLRVFQSCLQVVQFYLYQFLSILFFCLWFVNTSELSLLVWLMTFVSILALFVRMKRKRVLWRTLQ